VRLVPQLSAAVTVPHVAFRRVQKTVSVSETQVSLPQPLFEHVLPDEHEPHDATVRRVPQRSTTAIDPQSAFAREHSSLSGSGAQSKAASFPESEVPDA
jgi:hypothetical protein